MAYERTNWQNGDVISSEKLNKMEAGIEYACSLEHKVTDPTDGQFLKYDAESGKWVNGEGSGSSRMVVISNYDDSTNVATLDKTYQEIYDAFPNVVIDMGDGLYSIKNIINYGEGEKPYHIIWSGGTYYASTPADYPNTDDGDIS